MKRPSPLKKGDNIALIAPCGPVKEERIEPAVKAIKSLGLNVVLGECCTCSRGFLAGESDRKRADEEDKSLTLEQIFDDLIVSAKKPVIYNVACGHVHRL